jgi:shikimate kinase
MLKAILVGFMGAGKTTVGGVLAEQVGWKQIDLDDEIIATAGKPITVIFADDGEAAFRKLETQVLQDTFNKTGLLSTGGGVVESAANREVLQQTDIPVVYLQTSGNVVLDRVSGDDSRPLVNQLGPDGLKALLAKREHLYQGVSDLVIRTDDLTPEEISEQIQSFLKEPAE